MKKDPKNPYVVTLGLDDMFRASTAGLRQCVNGKIINMVDKKKEFHHRKYGVASELAYAEMVNIQHNIKVFSTDEGWDIISPENNKVDIKNTGYQDGKLICGDYNYKPDIFVLLTRSGWTFTYRGWAWKHDLRHPNNYKPLKDEGRPVYQLTQDQLHEGFPP